MATKKIPAFNDTELKILNHIFQSVWNYIAYDCLQATEECDGRSTMSRSEVIEVVLDADRPSEQAKTPEEKELVKRFYALDLKAQEKIVKPMFPSSRYGT